MKPSEINNKLYEDVSEKLNGKDVLGLVSDKNLDKVKDSVFNLIDSFKNGTKDELLKKSLKVLGGALAVSILGLPTTLLVAGGAGGYMVWKNNKEKNAWKNYVVGQSTLSEDEKIQFWKMSVSEFEKNARVNVERDTVKRFFQIQRMPFSVHLSLVDWFSRF